MKLHDCRILAPFTIFFVPESFRNAATCVWLRAPLFSNTSSTLSTIRSSSSSAEIRGLCLPCLLELSSMKLLPTSAASSSRSSTCFANHVRARLSSLSSSPRCFDNSRRATSSSSTALIFRCCEIELVLTTLLPSADLSVCPSTLRSSASSLSSALVVLLRASAS